MSVCLATFTGYDYPLTRNTKRIAEGPPSMDVTGPFRFLAASRVGEPSVLHSEQLSGTNSLISDMQIRAAPGVAQVSATGLARQPIHRRPGD